MRSDSFALTLIAAVAVAGFLSGDSRRTATETAPVTTAVSSPPREGSCCGDGGHCGCKAPANACSVPCQTCNGHCPDGCNPTAKRGDGR